MIFKDCLEGLIYYYYKIISEPILKRLQKSDQINLKEKINIFVKIKEERDLIEQITRIVVKVRQSGNNRH